MYFSSSLTLYLDVKPCDRTRRRAQSDEGIRMDQVTAPIVVMHVSPATNTVAMDCAIGRSLRGRTNEMWDGTCKAVPRAAQGVRSDSTESSPTVPVSLRADQVGGPPCVMYRAQDGEAMGSFGELILLLDRWLYPLTVWAVSVIIFLVVLGIVEKIL